MTEKTVSEIVSRCEALYEDLYFNAAREWKAAKPGRKVIGFMPLYVPRELIHAAGMLPLGIMGGGDNLEVIHGDAYYQSYICRIPRSTIELGVSGRLDFVDGMLFPSICDVIRNLSGMWKMLFPDVYSKYFDVPQTYRDEIGGEFYTGEMREFLHDLEGIAGRKITDDDIRASIEVYNENRNAIAELYALRQAQPWNAPASEAYLVLRAGLVLPVEEHTQLVRDYVAAAKAEPRQMKDNSRVVLTGMFCEQPPLNLIKSLELSGCFIVNDDFVLVSRWLMDNVPTEGDPVHNLSQAFLHRSMSTAAKYEPNEAEKGQFLVRQVRDANAEGVIFASTSFCDPALLDRPMMQNVLKANDVPFIAFKYAENSGQMQPIREQAGTFVDSIKLWSAA
ncbi:MAG: benzoyl-CoA reductase subunit C [Jhaorihella sp.]